MIITLCTTPALQRTMTFGSLHVDAVNRATAVREFASGKGINVARVTHALGRECVATGVLGGESGGFCKLDMDAAGIRHDFADVTTKTRMCITLVDQGNGTATELIEEAGAVSGSETEQLLAKLKSLLHRAKVLVLSGTLAPGCGDHFYARCVKLAREANVRAIVDAKGKPLSLALAEKPFVVKPNRAELAQTVNHPVESEDDLQEAISEIIRMGATWAVVTNGPAETTVSDGDEFWKLTTPKVRAINPIGSGDSFAAGVAVGLLDGASVPGACKLGVACGAANAMTELAGHVRREDVERLQTEITVRTVS